MNEEKNMRNRDLIGANLIGANLRDADLTGAILRGADLRRANLSGAILMDADLTSANLTDANLIGADLTDADLSRANLTDADLSRANLTDANLMMRLDLINANLSGANLKGANLKDAYLTEANLKGANLKGADLTDADLSFATLTDANLTGADLTGANLKGADLTGAKIDSICGNNDDLAEIRRVRNKLPDYRKDKVISNTQQKELAKIFKEISICLFMGTSLSRMPDVVLAIIGEYSAVSRETDLYQNTEKKMQGCTFSALENKGCTSASLVQSTEMLSGEVINSIKNLIPALLFQSIGRELNPTLMSANSSRSDIRPSLMQDAKNTERHTGDSSSAAAQYGLFSRTMTTTQKQPEPEEHHQDRSSCATM